MTLTMNSLNLFCGAAASSLVLVGAGAAQNPYAAVDGRWMSLTGQIEDVDVGQFTLDYGDSVVTVEMDDWDLDDDADPLAPGDQVTVNGRVDDDWGEITSIEARSVYVDARNTVYFASAADEESAVAQMIYDSPFTAEDGDWVRVSGLVENVKKDEFSLELAGRTITVDTEEMPYDPLDNRGYQKVSENDFVQVRGKLDDGFFQGRKVLAYAVTTFIPSVYEDDASMESSDGEKNSRGSKD